MRSVHEFFVHIWNEIPDVIKILPKHHGGGNGRFHPLIHEKVEYISRAEDMHGRKLIIVPLKETTFKESHAMDEYDCNHDWVQPKNLVFYERFVGKHVVIFENENFSSHNEFEKALIMRFLNEVDSHYKIL